MRTAPRVSLTTIVGVGLLLAADASFRCTVPGVNEPHYLAKARHFWNAAWCDRDLLMTSANAHWFFYAAVGWLAAVFSFPAAAWLGRIAGWGLLAWGWHGLASRLLAERGLVIGSTLIWLALAAPSGFSGEWVIGGVESKVFAYGLLFAGLAAALKDQPLQGGFLLGLSVAFHPLVGGWGVLATGFSLILRWFFEQNSAASAAATPGQAETSPKTVSSVFGRRFALAAVLLGLASLPGLIPAAAMLADAPNAEIARRANHIQVVERLPHHLVPGHFRFADTAWSATLSGVFLLGCWWTARDGTWRLWRGVVFGAALTALLGLIADQTPWRLSLLKFYPFRLIDGLLPCAAALELIGIWPAVRTFMARRSQFAALCAGRVLCAALFAIPFLWPAVDRVQPRWKPDNRESWLQVCEWVRTQTESDDLFLTPRYSFGFKWWAERAEYAVWKDCPQDATSLVEWKRRLDYISDWRKRHIARGFGTKSLNELATETGVDYVVAWNKDPFQVEPVYRNPSFSVYRIGAGNGKPVGTVPLRHPAKTTETRGER